MTLASGPLKGLRVLDLSRILAGPTATQLLGDLGADVVKVERPKSSDDSDGSGGGDDTRSWGPPYVMGKDGQPTSESGYYLSANRNKRSLAVDISSAEGAETVRRLASKADILVENFKKGGLEKYGLGYEALSELNRGLIYCAITGFGQTGPNSHRLGYDLMAQGYGGIMSLTGPEEGPPHKVGVAIADIMTGLYATSGILAALRHRDATGEGQYIDLALVDTQVSWLANQGVNYLLSGEVPKPLGNSHPNIVPYQVFRAEDGYVIIAVGNDHQFVQFAEMLGRGDLAEDERFRSNSMRLRHKDELVPILEACIGSYTRDGLLAECEVRGVPAGPVHDLGDVFATEQVAVRGMKISMDYADAAGGRVDLIGNPLKFSRTPVDYRHAPPKCGADNEAVLSDWLDGG